MQSHQVNIIEDNNELDEEISDMPAGGKITYEKRGTHITKHPKRTRSKASGPFHDELIKLMFGFGDYEQPCEASVDLLETYVEEFITNLVSRATRRS